jgi:class 3 adenylate cyclase/tRNA A-37 threonylcarbamoyl transferase component Bud32
MARRLAAILAADVVAYSRLMAADEAGTHARLTALRKEFMEPTIIEHHGRVVRLMGDGMLVEFSSVVDAVECAAAIQTGVGEHQANLPEDQRIVLRVGINLGDVIVDEEDIYGDGVNVAARLQQLARPGDICVARTVYDHAKAKVAFGFEAMGEHRVKNIPEPVTVYRLNTGGGDAAHGLTISPDNRSRYGGGEGQTIVVAGSESGERLTPGSILHNTYEIGRFIGSGGMGDIYQARNMVDGSAVAIKVIRQHLVDHKRMVELFRREGGALREVRHDAVVGYGGLFQDEQNRMFLVMDFVDGPSMAEKLKGGPLNVDQVLRLKDRLGRGLAEAHEKGVVHRDVSPDNVLLPGGKLERATIIDFGISKRADSNAGTVIGSDVAGKLAFVSPEQVGLFGGQVDARTDIYSLGLVLAAAARGRPLEMGRSWADVVETRKRPPDLADVPARLRPLLGKMLAPNPKDRPQSMEDVIGLRTDHDGTRFFRRAALLLLLVLLLAGGALWFGFGRDHNVLQAIMGIIKPATILTQKDAIDGQPDPALIRSAIETVQAGSECSNVEFVVDDTGRVELSGFVSSRDDLKNMTAGLGSIAGVTAVNPDRVKVQTKPICQVLQALAPYQKRNAEQVLGLAIRMPEGEVLRDGDALNISLQTPVFASYLYVDYIQQDGLTVHVIQTPAGQQPVPANQQLLEQTPYKIGPPFGREIVVTIASASPLFESARPESEDAADYLPALQQQLAQLGPDQKVAASHVFVDTEPRPAND